MCAIPRAQADVLTTVNNALLNIIQNTSVSLVDGPPEIGREIAMVDGSIFDAVNAASGRPYAPIAYGGGPVVGASADAATLQAAITVMNSLYENPASPYQQYKGITGAEFYGASSPYKNQLVGPSLTQMTEVAAQIHSLTIKLAGLGGTSDVIAGIALGTQAGDAMIAARANDGGTAASVQTLTPYVPPNEGQPGVYVPPTIRPAMMPTWGTVTPFGMSAAIMQKLEATVPALPAINSQAYALQVLATECLGPSMPLPSSIRSACSANGFLPATPAQSLNALFWNDPGGTYQPPGHWLQIADTVGASQGLTLLQHAREDTLVGQATADAGVGAWDIKYIDNLWRAITAIRNCNRWNPFFTTCDPTWSSLIATPPHPDYLAGHPTFSGAAATVLADFFGTDNIGFTSTSQAYCNAGSTLTAADGTVIGCVVDGVTYSTCVTLPPGAIRVAGPFICSITESFTSFSDAAISAELSRIYGGIHTPMAVENGLALGDLIGATLMPEPPILPVLAGGLLALGVLRFRGQGALSYSCLDV